VWFHCPSEPTSGVSHAARPRGACSAANSLHTKPSTGRGSTREQPRIFVINLVNQFSKMRRTFGRSSSPQSEASTGSGRQVLLYGLTVDAASCGEAACFSCMMLLIFVSCRTASASAYAAAVFCSLNVDVACGTGRRAIGHAHRLYSALQPAP